MLLVVETFDLRVRNQSEVSIERIQNSVNLLGNALDLNRICSLVLLRNVLELLDTVVALDKSYKISVISRSVLGESLINDFLCIVCKTYIRKVNGNNLCGDVESDIDRNRSCRKHSGYRRNSLSLGHAADIDSVNECTLEESVGHELGICFFSLDSLYLAVGHCNFDPGLKETREIKSCENAACNKQDSENDGQYGSCALLLFVGTLRRSLCSCR